MFHILQYCTCILQTIGAIFLKTTLTYYKSPIKPIMIPMDKVTLKKSQCFMYDPDSIGDGISANRSQWQTIKCMHGWQYNFTGYYTSISTKVSVKPGLLHKKSYTCKCKFRYSLIGFVMIHGNHEPHNPFTLLVLLSEL